MNRTVRLLLIALCATVGLTTAGLVPAVAADPTYTISGTVLDYWDDEPLAGVAVEVFTADPAAGPVEPAAATTTGANGRYSIVAPAGPVWIRWSAEGFRTLTERVTLTANVTRNASLEIESGALSGAVQLRGGAAPECGAVAIFRANETDVDEALFGELSTDEDGTFSIDEFPVGDYKFLAYDECADGIASVWVGTGTTFETAQVFTVAVDQILELPVTTLDPGSLVSGKVTNAAGKALEHVEIYIRSTDDTYKRTVATTVQGSYELRHVPDGEYEIWASDTLGEYADSDRRTVVVNGTAVPNLSFQLTANPAGAEKTIVGKVTGPGGKPAVGITVYAIGRDDEEDEQVDTARTRRDGTYQLNAPTGEQYKIYFESTSTGDRDDEDEGWYDDYVSEWFDNARTMSRAKVVSLTVAHRTKAFVANAQLVKTATIQGRIYYPEDADGFVEGYVRVYDADDDLVGATFADENGAYSMRGLTPGHYRLRFDAFVDWMDEDFGSGYGLVREYWNNRFSLGSAQVVSVGDGAVRSHVNVLMSDTLSAVTAPKVTGWAKKGKVLTANRGTWSLSVGTQYAYQWYRNSTPISGARGAKYTLTSADVGKQVRVRVVASNVDGAYRPGVAWSGWTAKVVK